MLKSNLMISSTISLFLLVENFKIQALLKMNVTIVDREKELNELMSTKAGVKGLVDSGVSKIPEIFKVKHSDDQLNGNKISHFNVPLINLEGLHGERRKEIVDEVLEAAKEWGVFQVVSHGVPLDVMKNMLECVSGFHEQTKEVKEEFYSHDSSRKVWYYMTVHPVLMSALWKDTIACQFEDLELDFQSLPLICRKPMSEYVTQITNLKSELSKLLYESLGLDSNHLEQMECMKPRKIFGHYYPSCPEPELTMGTPKHSDPYFLTILLQGNIDGLQVLHQNQWINVKPLEGALNIIIGDMLQLISNDEFKSAEHRVLATKYGPRLSTACFFYPTGLDQKERLFGPVKELVFDHNPALYKDVTHSDYLKHYSLHGCSGCKPLPYFRL